MKKFAGVLLLFIAIAGLVGGSRLLRLNNPDAISSSRPIAIFLQEKVNLDQLGSILADSADLVNNKKELLWAGKLLGWRNFQPGRYQVDSGFTYDAFLSKLAKGNQDPLTLTIIPGQSKKSLIYFLSQQLRFDSLAIKEVLDDSSFLAENNITDQSLIGHFFPATYDLYWTSNPDKVMDRILKEFNTQVAEPYTARLDELEKSLNEIVALASIIEWEAARDDEMPQISGLYWNRLERGMRLQADPTVNFAVKERRRLYYKDYEIDHPYNTYVHRGLPPGPITNPSLNSIKAALYPADHDYLFMVAKPNGYHAFTKTFAEHKQKSAEWRDYIQEQQRIKEAREAERDTSEGS